VFAGTTPPLKGQNFVRTRRLVGVATVVVSLLATALPVTVASASTAVGTRADPGAAAGPAPLVVRRDRDGRAHYLGARRGAVVERATTRAPAAAAREHLRHYGSVFGVSDSDLRGGRVTSLRRGASVVRFQQTRAGLPVFGGQLSTALDPHGGLVSVVGETSTRVLSTAFWVPASAARAAALRATAREQKLAVRRLRASAPQRWLYDPSLFRSAAPPGARAAWILQVTAAGVLDVRELVVVDAATGAVLLHFNQVPQLDRVVCDNRNARKDDYACGPGRYVESEGGPASAVPDVNAAYDSAKAASDFYAGLGVDLTALIGSDLGDGKKLRSTVRVCPTSGSCPYDNAFWDGTQMVYGSGFAAADDVVAHELTHGVTQHTSGLVYWYQSGAINESMSDVFGELVDQTDGIGNDDPSVRWLLGEDLSVGVARSMSNPKAFQQPDQVGGQFWNDTFDDDNGAVHTNSGVGNKAAYLIADGTVGEPGGAFGGLSFPGLGLTATSRIYWITQQLLSPGADYSDLADALYAACLTVGVPQAECDTTVKGATAATLMQSPSFVSPSPPQAVSITGGDGHIRLRWSPPASQGTQPVNSYVLTVSPAIDSENFLPLDTSPRNQVIDGVPPGKTYTFGLSAVSSHGNSAAVQRTLLGTTLTITSPRSVALGRRFALRGRLTVTDNGMALPSRPVTLLRRLSGAKRFTVLTRTRTSASGAYAFRLQATRGATYVASFAPVSSLLMGTHSGRRAVVVRQRVALRALDATVRRGQAVQFRGRVTPRRSGKALLQRRGGDGRWVGVRAARVDARGRFRLSWTPRGPGAYSWRAVVGRAGGLAAGVSPIRIVRIR
jgi:Zn-dependent metalloprotease